MTANASFFAERRRHRRFGISRDGKVYSPDTRSYSPAQTRDLSVGGAMLEVEADRPFATGQRVGIAVASTTDGVVRNESMVQAVVVRAEALRGRKQTIAVRYLGSERANAAA